MEIRIDRKAVQDLRELEDFYRNNVNSYLYILARINIQVKLLEKFPEMGKKVKDNKRQVIVSDTNIILPYIIKGDSFILVLRFFDTRQNPKKLFTKTF